VKIGCKKASFQQTQKLLKIKIEMAAQFRPKIKAGQNVFTKIEIKNNTRIATINRDSRDLIFGRINRGPQKSGAPKL
jgi:hypothetical protein